MQSQHTSVDSARLLHRTLLLATLALVAIAAASPAWAAATATPVIGEIQRITLDDPSSHWSGGTIVVGGQVVIIPRNLLIDLPANRVTLRQLFLEAPPACAAVGETGLAKGDTCSPGGAAGVATIAANRTSGGTVIAGDVLIDKGLEVVTGVVTYLDHADGYFRLNGTAGDPATGLMVRLNDPEGRHTVQQGLGCAGGPNCSADPRFGLDPDNYTNVFTTGFPLCIPSTRPRTFVDVLGLGVTTAQASAAGAGDVLCPQTNRPASASTPVDDSRRFAPLRVGDSITAEGNTEVVGGVRFLSAHTSRVARALLTRNLPGQPDYLFLEEVFVEVAGFQNQRARALIIGFTTLAPTDVLFWSIHYDPAANAPHLFPLASVRGCDLAAGAGECGAQGLVGAGANIFKINYDVDFLAGAKTKVNPCAHLRAEARFGAPTICPSGGVSGANVAEMLAVLSPVPREIQARTGHALANPGLVTLDVNGRQATSGQYLFPFGMGLGGVAVPELIEVNLDALSTPIIFAGVPWNLDRRLSPGGCEGGCEATPQPLDPFPFSGLDPRTQASAFPTFTYADAVYTASPLTRPANRILSYVDPALGKFNGDASLLAWPPIDPSPRPISPTPEVALVCAAPPPPNQAPVALADAASTVAGAPVTVAVLANDFDPDGDPLTVTGVTDGAAGTVVTNGNSVTYTPAAGFTGADAFAYTISDGAGGTASAPVTVTVDAPANVPPVAEADAATTPTGVPVVIAVLANDHDADGGTLSIIAVTQGASGAVVNDGGSVAYTPAPGFTGADAFTYMIADGQGGVAIGSVAVTVVSPEVLVVQTALFRTAGAEWRVSGTTTLPGATLTIRLGAAAGGALVGSTTASGAGNWSFRQPGSAVPPDASRQVSIESSGGATRLGVPVTVR